MQGVSGAFAASSIRVAATLSGVRRRPPLRDPYGGSASAGALSVSPVASSAFEETVEAVPAVEPTCLQAVALRRESRLLRIACAAPPDRRAFRSRRRGLASGW